MRKLIIAALTAASLFASVPTADAAPIRECGSIYYGGIRNITARNVSCSDARSFARKLVRQGLPRRSGWIRLPGWKPYYGTFRQHGLSADLRSVRSNKVIRFQFHADEC